VPVGDLLARVLPAPLIYHVGDVGDLHSEDERQALGFDRLLAGSSERRDQWIYYQYKAGRARRTLHGIDEQVAKAAQAVAGLAPVKRNRFIALDGAVKSVNRELEAKARTLAGIKGVICGSSRRSLENPGSRNPSPWPVSKYRVLTS
jgi:hypothetical protein